MKYSFTGQTRTSLSDSRSDLEVVPFDGILMDYTTVPDGWRIVGHLSTGQVAKSTIRCRKCARVGLLAESERAHLIVHLGHVRYKTLYPVDYCDLSITAH